MKNLTLLLLLLAVFAADAQTNGYGYPGTGFGTNITYTVGSSVFGAQGYAVYGGSAFGAGAVALDGGVAFGNGAYAFKRGMANGLFAVAHSNGVAAGYMAYAGPYKVQIGTGRNTTDLFRVFDTPVLNSSGRVPLTTEYARPQPNPLPYVDAKAELAGLSISNTTRLTVSGGYAVLDSTSWASAPGTNGTPVAGGAVRLVSASDTFLHGADAAGRLVYSADGETWARAFVRHPYDVTLKYPVAAAGKVWAAAVTDDRGTDLLLVSKNGVAFEPLTEPAARAWLCAPAVAPGGIVWAIGLEGAADHAALYRIPTDGTDEIRGLWASTTTANDARAFSLKALPLDRTEYTASDCVRVIWYPFSTATAYADVCYLAPAGALNNLNPYNAAVSATSGVVCLAGRVYLARSLSSGVGYGNSASAFTACTGLSAVTELFAGAAREDGTLWLLAREGTASARSLFVSSDEGASWGRVRNDLPQATTLIRRGGVFWLFDAGGAMYRFTDDNVLEPVSLTGGATAGTGWVRGIYGTDAAATNSLFFRDQMSGATSSSSRLATESAVTAHTASTAPHRNAQVWFLTDGGTNGLLAVTSSNLTFSVWGVTQ